MSEVAQATLGVEYLPPDARQPEQIVSGWQRRCLLFDQHPGDGSGVTQVDREFQVRTTQEGMLAGQTPYQAGQFRITRQELVPKGLVAAFADSVQTMTASVMQRRTERRLAGGYAQQQSLGTGAMTVEVDQGWSDHILTQFIRRDTHDALEQLRADGRWSLAAGG